MAFLEKPNGWKHWLKQSARMCFPMMQDFYGCWDATKEFVAKVGGMLLKLIVRLCLLVSFPISIPLLTYMFTKQNRRTMEYRANWLSTEQDGFPPQYTREEVDRVLRGECTLEQLEKEREVKWASGLVVTKEEN
jgi:hypothetical protein